MVDPSKHADKRGWIESVLRYVPGFRGYLEKEYRRDSDHLTRTHLADRLLAAKRAVSEYQRSLLDAGRLDELTSLERTATLIETLINRIKGDVRGYSGFFDFVQIDEEALDRIYENDLALVTEVDTIVKEAEALQVGRDEPASVAAHLQSKLRNIEDKYSHRAKILNGLEPKA